MARSRREKSTKAGTNQQAEAASPSPPPSAAPAENIAASKSAGPLKPPLDARARKLRARKRWAIAGASLLAFYTLFGFVGVPLILRKIVVPKIGEGLTGSIGLAKAAFNPFTFTLRLDGLEVKDGEGGQVAGFGRFDMDFDPFTSLFSRGWCFKDVLLVDPLVFAELFQDGRVNFQRLMKPAPAGAGETTADTPKQSVDDRLKNIPRLIVTNLAVQRADIRVRDHTPRKPFETQWSDLSFQVDTLDTRPDFSNIHKLSAKTAAGEELSWEGTIHVDPLSSKGKLTVRQLGLPNFMPYVEEVADVEVRGGKFSLTVNYDFAPVRVPRTATVNLEEAVISDLEVAQHDQPLLTAPEFKLAGIDVDADKRTVRVETIAFTSPHIRVERLADGSISLEKIMRSAEKATASAPLSDLDVARMSQPLSSAAPIPTLNPPQALPPLTPIDPTNIDYPLERLNVALAQLATDIRGPWSLVVEGVEISGGAADFVDRSTRRPVELAVQQLNLKAGPVRTEENYAAPFQLDAALASGGKIEVSGRVAALDGHTDVKIMTDSLELGAGAAYLPSQLPDPLPPLDLAAAQLFVNGAAKVKWSAEGATADWTGLTRLAAVRVDASPAAAAPATQWEDFSLEGPLAIRIAGEAAAAEWEGELLLKKLAVAAALKTGPLQAEAESFQLKGKFNFDSAADPMLAWRGDIRGTNTSGAYGGGAEPISAGSREWSVGGEASVASGEGARFDWKGKAIFAGANFAGPMGQSPGKAALDKLEIDGSVSGAATGSATVDWDGAIALAQVVVETALEQNAAASRIDVGQLDLKGKTAFVGGSASTLGWNGELRVASVGFGGPVAGPVEAKVEQIDLTGDLQVAAGGANPGLIFTGATTVRSIAAKAPEVQQTDIAVEQLSIENANLRTAEESFSADRILVRAPKAQAALKLMPAPSDAPHKPLEKEAAAINVGLHTAGAVAEAGKLGQRAGALAGDVVREGGQLAAGVVTGDVARGALRSSEKVLDKSADHLLDAERRVHTDNPLLKPGAAVLDAALKVGAGTLESGAAVARVGEDVVRAGQELTEPVRRQMERTAQGVGREFDERLRETVATGAQVVRAGGDAVARAGETVVRAASLQDRDAGTVKDTQTPPADASAAGQGTGGPAIKLPYAVKIGEIVIEGGALTISDETSTPPTEIVADQVQVKLSPVSSDGQTATDVLIESRLYNSGAVRMTGKADPFRNDVFADLQLEVTTLPLKPYDAFSTRFLGYEIERGRSTIKLPLKVENGHLDGTLNFQFDAFYLGKKVASKEAPDLPIPLGLDILRDRQDQIAGRIPFSGDLNDPSFSLGGLIWKAVLNFLLKVVTAPFDIIAGSLGLDGGDDLSQIAFAAGSIELGPEAVVKLDALHRALQERPKLKMTVVGHYAEADVGALKAKAYRAQYEQNHPGPVDETAYAAAVSAEYARRFGSVASEGFAPPPTTSDESDAGGPVSLDAKAASLGRDLAVPPELLIELASKRAEAVVKVLVEDLRLPADRVNTAPAPEDKAKAETPGAKFELK